MTKTPHITLNNLSFHLDQTLIAFDELNLSFGQQVYGIVGKNGSGKSTLLNLITGALAPNSGSVQHSGTIMLAPQSHTAIPKDHSIADTLEVTNYLIALKKINQGSTDDRLFECLEGQWDIESRIENVLSQLQLWPVDLNMQFHQLSGGQKTKILLARTWLADADFILFDEPTNNLDAESREILYQFIQSSKKGLLIVSHDRTLLNLCHNIIEISSKGVEKFGGNYDFYKEQKDLQTAALEQEIKTNKEYLKKSKKLTQTRMERHQQNEAKGKKKVAAQIKAKGSYDQIEFKGSKAQSEKTNRRIRLQADKKMGSANSKLSSSLEKLEADKTLHISLPNTAVPNGKIVIDINDLCFSYDEKKPLLNQFNLHLAGPKRIAISGKNGSGKSTLIKLIRGLLTPEYGNITVGVSHIAYLDQSVSFLNPELSIVENFLLFNPKSTAFDAYSALASFKFRNKDAEKTVGNLSGGEKIRAGLAVSLLSSPAPQLLILDEPTNHLDLHAIEAIEAALTIYEGAILAISHDKNFLENIKIQKIISLD